MKTGGPNWQITSVGCSLWVGKKWPIRNERFELSWSLGGVTSYDHHRASHPVGTSTPTLSNQARLTMVVGVLALQGSFNEHIAALRRVGVKGIEVRKAEQLEKVSSLIIPGGESTTMAKLAHYHNLVLISLLIFYGLDCSQLVG